MLPWLALACTALLLLSLPAGFAPGADRNPHEDFALRRAALELAAGRPDAAARVLGELDSTHVAERNDAEHNDAEHYDAEHNEAERAELAVLLQAQARLLAGDAAAIQPLHALLDARSRFVRAQAALHVLSSDALSRRMPAGQDAPVQHALPDGARQRALGVWLADARDVERQDAELGALGDVLVAWHAWQDGDRDRAHAAVRRSAKGHARAVARVLAAEWQLDHGDARRAAEMFRDVEPGQNDGAAAGSPSSYAGWLADWSVLGRARSLIAAEQTAAARDVLDQVRQTPHLEQYAAYLQAQIAYAEGDLDAAARRLASFDISPWNVTLAAEAALLRVQLELDRGQFGAAESLSMQLVAQPWLGGNGQELELALQIDVDALHQAQVRATLGELARLDVLRHLPQAMLLASSASAVRLENAAPAARVALLQPYQHALSDVIAGLDAAAADAAVRVRAARHAGALAQAHAVAAARALAQRQELLGRARSALHDHAAQLDSLGILVEKLSAALVTYRTDLLAQEAAWNRLLGDRFTALAASLDALQRATTRLAARYPPDRSVRASADIDRARSEQAAIAALQDSLRGVQDDLARRHEAVVRAVLHDFEPGAAEAAVANLLAMLARLRDHTAALAARLDAIAAAEQLACARAQAGLADAEATSRRVDAELAHAAGQAAGERRRARLERHALYIEAAHHAVATAAFHAALADTSADDARRLTTLAHAAARLVEFLEQHPHALRADEALYRLGEVHLQQASVRHRADLAAFLAQGGKASDAPVPVEDYADAIDAYERLLRDHPASPRGVDAQYQLGFLMAEMARLEDSAAHLDAFLAAASPDDPRRGRAALRLGDDALLIGDGERACTAFGLASESHVPETRDLGLFKLGWCQYEHDRHDAARQALRTLLELAQHAAADSPSRARDLQPEALELLALCFAEDHTAPEAAIVLDAWGRPAYEFVLLRRMAQLFASRAQFDEAIGAYETLLARHPLRPEAAGAVDEWVQLVRLHRGDVAAFAVAAELAPHFAPAGEWAKAARSTSGDAGVQPAWQSRLVEEDARVARADSLAAALAAPEQAAQHMARWLRGAAVFTHQQAKSDSSQARLHLERAARLYEQTLAQFPGAGDEATTWLYLGEARHGLGEHARAADAYAAVATTSTDSGLVHRAAVAEIAALDAAAASDAAHLGRYAARARHHVSRWPDDSQGVDALERVGELAFLAERDTMAENAYSLFAARTPDRARAALALKAVGDVAWRRQEFEPASTRYARAAETARQAGADSLVAVLDVLVPGSLVRAAEAREANGDRKGAAALHERVAEEHRNFAHADRSLYRAAELRTAAGDTSRAIADHLRLVEAYPGSDLRPDAALQLARLEEGRGRKREAARLYQRFAAEHHEHAQAGAAQLRAGDLFARSGDVNAADTIFAAVLRDVHPAGTAPRDPALAAELWLRRARFGGDAPRVTSHYARALECGSVLAASDAAEARFHVTESSRPAYEAIELRQPLTESLAAKQRALEPLLAGYTQVAQAGVEPWHAAASLRVGEALSRLAEALRTSQPPAELEGDDLYAYQEALFLQAQELEDRAVQSWSAGLRAARDVAHADTWTQQLQAALYPMLARRVPTRPAPLFVLAQPE